MPALKWRPILGRGKTAGIAGGDHTPSGSLADRAATALADWSKTLTPKQRRGLTKPVKPQVFDQGREAEKRLRKRLG